MSINIRIYNIDSPNPFRVSYKISDYMGSELTGYTTYNDLFPASTTGVTISGVTIDYDTNIWVKITDNVTNTFTIRNIKTCDICAYPAVACDMEVEVTCINCDIYFEVICYYATPTPTPTPTNTPTNTPTITITQSVTPTSSIPSFVTPTPTPSKSTPLTFYFGLRRYDGSDGFNTYYYTTVPLSSGECFCSTSQILYRSTGRIYDITGLTQLDGSVVSCLYGCSQYIP